MLHDKPWLFSLKNIPFYVYSKLMRQIGSLILPKKMRKPVLGWIAKKMKIDLTEAECDIGEYPCFSDLFTRRLQSGLRPICELENTLVSPVDGCVIAMGSIREGTLIQAKGLCFSLENLLASHELAKELEGGAYITFWLRPKDYHRVHSPISSHLIDLRHIKGTFFPVKPNWVEHVPFLYNRNERVVMELKTDLGKIAMVCVAAAGVGNISTAFQKKDNAHNAPTINIPLEKGQEIATFNLGSTVILIGSSKNMIFEPLHIRQEVRMGELLAKAVNRSLKLP